MWRVAQAENKDWEDIAAFKTATGECFLYIGDIGDNERKRGELKIYRVKEPEVSGAGKSSTRKNAGNTENAEAIRIRFRRREIRRRISARSPADGRHLYFDRNAGTPLRAFTNSRRITVWTKINKLKKIADVSVPSIPNGFLTGGAISPDGRRVDPLRLFRRRTKSLCPPLQRISTKSGRRKSRSLIWAKERRAKRSTIHLTETRFLRRAKR